MNRFSDNTIISRIDPSLVGLIHFMNEQLMKSNQLKTSDPSRCPNDDRQSIELANANNLSTPMKLIPSNAVDKSQLARSNESGTSTYMSSLYKYNLFANRVSPNDVQQFDASNNSITARIHHHKVRKAVKRALFGNLNDHSLNSSSQKTFTSSTGSTFESFNNISFYDSATYIRHLSNDLGEPTSMNSLHESISMNGPPIENLYDTIIKPNYSPIAKHQSNFTRVSRQPNHKGCVFCKNNGLPPEWYSGHLVRDPETGFCSCPTLRKYICPICGTPGGPDKAHTVSYCPLKSIKIKQQEIHEARMRSILNSANA